MANRMTNLEERILMVKAMKYIARQINDETVFDTWLTLGVADGDIEYGNLKTPKVPDDDEAYWYAENEEDFADLMQVFLGCMRKAQKNGGLYCGNVVSKYKQ